MQLLPTPDNTPAPLDAGQVHLWLLDVRLFDEPLRQAAQQLMSADELERAGKFIRGKEEYVASRWLLRKVLGHYLQQPPASLVFSRTYKGKPYIAGSQLQFNLSHSGDWALLAATQNMDVGVDIEQIRPSRDLIGIAQSYYHADEFVRLQQQQGDQQILFFYQLWTLKEALLKAMGVGISAGLENLNFDLTPPISVRLSDTLKAESTTKWQFHQWQLPDGELCALAVASDNPAQIRIFNPLTALYG